MKKHIVKTAIVEIGWLKPNPENVYPLSDIPTLANLMDAERMQTPIEVLEDGTIVKGHRRHAAAKLLGWETVEVVIVRYDTHWEMLMAMFHSLAILGVLEQA